MSKENKNFKTNLKSILLSVVSSLIILLLAAIIYLYASGYRIDILSREIKQTGVITIQSEPSSADVYINGENKGRTPKSAGLEIGNWKISLKKDTYKEWNKEISILEGKNTPVFPFMIYDTTQRKEKWTSQGEFVKIWTNGYKNNFVFLLKEAEEKYSLWEYTINTPLWDFSSNPTKFLDLTTNKVDILMSPDGQEGILTLTQEKKPSFYIVNLQQTNTLRSSNQLPFGDYSTYTKTWSKNNKYIILESAQKLLSYDAKQQTFVPLLEKLPDTTYTWNTDGDGFLYYTTPILDENITNIYTYSLTQKSLDGITTKLVLEKIYFQSSDTYIKEYRENNLEIQEFTNSPESTQSSGKITSLDINQAAKGMYIGTEQASYWYYMDTNKFMMISSYPTELLSYSPDNYKLSLMDTTGYKVFTFYKEKEDHTVDIGSKNIKDLTNIPFWLSNSSYLYFLEDLDISICDIDGDNKNIITSTNNIQDFAVNNMKTTLYTLEKQDTGELKIFENKFH